MKWVLFVSVWAELVRALGGAVASTSLLGVPLGHDSSFLQGPEEELSATSFWGVKLESSKGKLHQGYQEYQNKKKKIQVLDTKNLPLEPKPQRGRGLSKNKWLN
ncbi:hypothetical protein L3X38_013111 [Prunus dulcis]|uniref:Uncharacterized protein n=1 Tax=Prunus dulcis TaxID=3755 RepID=A0AAD4ZGQ6_PRUDU|nr:hypothetical protein L3X38_013111 [Prunus dulcis]